MSTDGDLNWLQEGGSSGFDYGTAVSVNDADACFVAGGTTGNIGGNQNQGSFDAFIVKYDDDGVLQ